MGFEALYGKRGKNMRHNNKIIAFQGIEGAHSDLACRQAYPDLVTQPYPTFIEAIQAVEEGKADLCMIPIENSKAGRVAEIHNLLSYTKLHIVGEYFLRIEHFLMASKGTALDDIKVIYSHPQALMQCQNTIRGLGKKIECLESSNTAVAAKNVSEWNDKTKAAIASHLAAKLYHLDILKKNVEDSNDNTTVFIAMSKEATQPNIDKGKVITSVLFTVNNIPSALYRALGTFANNEVNLIKIESYIPTGQSQEAQFFVNLEGSPKSRNVTQALEELECYCSKIRILGAYLADKARKL